MGRGNVSAYVVGAVDVAKEISAGTVSVVAASIFAAVAEVEATVTAIVSFVAAAVRQLLTAVVFIPFIPFCSLAAHFVESLLTNDLLSSLLREGLSVEVVQLKALIRIGKVQALKKKFKIIHCLFFLELLRIFLRKYFSLKMCFT